MLEAHKGVLMYTTDATYAACEEEIKGSISFGKLADVVIPAKMPTRDGFEDAKVTRTVIKASFDYMTEIAS